MSNPRVILLAQELWDCIRKIQVRSLILKKELDLSHGNNKMKYYTPDEIQRKLAKEEQFLLTSETAYSYEKEEFHLNP